ncbi:MAG: bifunctional demethylmenaquinone methyltransferase/2-methoxy-6-polyprenyl-1,4-benzoquinol methylase UbiE [Bacteroidales bacterium]|nr:bifunctional demethylmenaquinone methyltransferase/2-methoxy-6-polyprenyl-1,4-benzoquinol methylase UbiE [Bacteroidales bacterium]
MEKGLSKEHSTISAMFNSIAGKYDLLNHLLSLGIDKGWRRKLVKSLKRSSSKVVLDLACGTGDLTIALYKEGFTVTGADLSINMLEIARHKSEKIAKEGHPLPSYIECSAESLPFEDSSFDAVTISFGIRNFQNRDTALQEILRVLKSNGRLAILEFATPRNFLWRVLYNTYFSVILPIIGRIISKDARAYRYLPESVKEFPQYETFCKEIEKQGFKNINFKPLTGGVAVLYFAEKLG